MPNLLEIKLYGCSVLKKKAEPVEEITQEIKDFVEDLIHTMYVADGVGLAAPQVGVSKRIFVCDPIYHLESSQATADNEENRNPVVLINPELVDFSGEQSFEEGCLSLPNVFENVIRFESIKMKYTDLFGNEQVISAERRFAVILQHEFDHLNGLTFVDRLPTLRKMALGFKLNRIVKEAMNMENDPKIVVQA